MIKLRRYPFAYNPILEYYEKIVSGEIVVSLKVRKVYKHLVDNIHNSKYEYEYRPNRANHAIEFVENYCKHSKGKWGGTAVVLELWQKALVAAIFGFVHKIDDVRQYQEVLLVVARKNGKSTLASAIGLYLMAGDGEAGAEVYAVATKRDQAKIIWKQAKQMVMKSPILRRRIKPLVAEMTADFNDSTFQPLGSDSNTLDGLNVHGALLDEIHAWKLRDLYDVIVDGCSSREQPLIFETTTAGTIREGLYDDRYEEAENVIRGYDDKAETAYRNDRFLPVIYELDNRNEWTNEKCWPKANPGLGTIKSIDILRNKVYKAKANPKLVKNLLCKDFNIRETSIEAWLDDRELEKTGKFDVHELRPRYGIGGADLSSSVDLTAAKVVFMLPEDNRVYVLSMYWIPEDLLDQRVQEDKVPYDLWVDAGYVRTCPGNKVHAKYVTQWFKEVQDEFDIYITWVGYDSWSAQYWVEEMKNEFGKESMIPVVQGKKTLSAPMKQLKADLGSKIVIYNDNPVDRWCLANTSVDVDKNDNIQPVKTSNPRRRIDGTAALLDAYVVLIDKLNEYTSMI